MEEIIDAIDGITFLRRTTMVDPKMSNDFLTHRLRCNLTLKELSERTGLSSATIHRIENGITRATERSMVKLSDGLGLEISELERMLLASWNVKHQIRDRHI